MTRDLANLADKIPRKEPLFVKEEGSFCLLMIMEKNAEEGIPYDKLKNELKEQIERDFEKYISPQGKYSSSEAWYNSFF
ncbi:MAG: hypothetical protein PHF86_12880 [Candidatus Nanoarchaeia archaeon]|nr:hypothetical protein [Candidatus Nanoarchaeia archaeon]